MVETLPIAVLPSWLFWAKFVIFGFFSTPSTIFHFWKKAKKNLAFFGLFWPIRFFMSIWQI